MVRLTLDFETFFSSEYSLRKMTMQEYIMDPRFEAQCLSAMVNGGKPEVIEHQDIKKWLGKWDWSTVTMTAHNCMFDAAIVAWVFGHRPATYECTRFMSQALLAHSCGSSSLAVIAKLFNMRKDSGALDAVKGLTVAAMDKSSPEYKRWIAYAADDAVQCEVIRGVCVRSLSPEELRVMHLLVRMYVEGEVELDDALLRVNLNKVQRETRELFARTGVDSPKDITSRDKFAELLKDLGVDPPTKISETTGKETWAFSKKDPEFMLLENHISREVRALVECRLNAASSLEETRTKRFLRIAALKDGRLKIPLLYSGAHTHRFSGMDSLNLQNLPRGSLLRNALRAPDGKKLVVIDASQIEARILAWLAGQMELVAAFATGEDVYASFATKVMGFEVNKKDHPTERFFGKTGILGLGYNAGWAKFHWMCNSTGKEASEDFCREVVKTYRTGYPEIPRLWARAHAAIPGIIRGVESVEGPVAFSKRKFRLPSGLNVVYPRLEAHVSIDDYGRPRQEFRYWRHRYRAWTSLYGGKLVENIVQALARLQITDTMVKMDNLNPEWFCAMQVHDELMYIVDENEAEDCYRELNTAMCAAPRWAEVKDYGVPLAAEGGIGDRYGDIK